MNPDKIRKLVAAIVALPLFIIGIGLILGLSWWWIAVMTIIIPVIVIVWILKPTAISLVSTAASPSWFSAKFAAAKKDLPSTAVIVVVLLLIGYGVFSYWQDSSLDEIRSVGGTSINLGEIPDWYKIEVWPKDEEFGTISVFSGKHEFRYWIGKDNYGTEYYQARILYNGKEIGPIGGAIRKFTNTPLPLIAMNTGSGGTFLPDISVSAGEIEIVSGRSYLANDAPVKGPVSIQSDKAIKEVRIFYASPWEKIKKI